MDVFQDTVIILPSLNPDEKLLQVVEGLVSTGFKNIVIINDGSDSDHTAPFEKASGYPECTILTHEVNQGKGRALKTGFSYCLEHFPDSLGVVTVDGDNQHAPSDIYSCALSMCRANDTVFLGVRDFDSPSVPKKSRLGNTLTRTVFKFACGIRISDTQTGLRAIPKRYLADFIGYLGERYEYETNMLLEMKSAKIPFMEIPIQTIYIDNNSSTHFHPIRDSIKVYRVIFRFLCSSVTAALIDLFFFWLAAFLLGCFVPDFRYDVYVATLIARILSSFCNYKLNQTVVFESRSKGTFVRYYCLCAVQLCVSALVVSCLSGVFGAESVGKTVIKAIIDTLLFFISFRIQREWVFRK